MTESLFHKEYLSLAQTLYRIAYYMLESEVEAEDAVQEVYAKIWELRDKLGDVQSLRPTASGCLKTCVWTAYGGRRF